MIDDVAQARADLREAKHLHREHGKAYIAARAKPGVTADELFELRREFRESMVDEAQAKIALDTAQDAAARQPRQVDPVSTIRDAWRKQPN